MKNKSVLFLVIALLAFFCLSGCASSKASMMINGEEVAVGTLLTIDGNKISLFEFRHYYFKEKNAVDSGDDFVWEKYPELEEGLADKALSSIKYAYAMQKYASDIGVRLSLSDKQDVSNAIADTKTKYGSIEGYNAYLESQYLDAQLYKKMLTDSKTASLIYEKLFGTSGTAKIKDSDVYDYIRENYIRYKMIFIKLDYDGTDTNRKLAAEIIERLNAGESFDDLMSAYSRDVNSRNYPNGYYVSKNNETETLKAVESLEAGDYTKEYIETSEGFYIFRRMGMENTELRNDIETFRNILEGNYIDEKVNEYIDKLKIEFVSDYYDEISIKSLFY